MTIWIDGCGTGDEGPAPNADILGECRVMQREPQDGARSTRSL